MSQPPSDVQPDTPAPFTLSAATAARLAEVKAPRRSLGLKLLLVCALALLMSIPALFVFGLLMDPQQPG